MSFQDFLEKSKVVILDGGMSTALERLGLTMSNPIWNGIGLVAAPKLVEQAHQNFFDAGAHIVITNTYYCSSWIFKQMNFSIQDSRDYLSLAVQLAQSAREQSKGEQEKFVAGGISCYGVQFSNLSEYTGNYDFPDSEYYAYHKERMDIFYENGVDLFAIETIPNYQESLVLLELLKEYPNMNAFFSSTLSDAKHLGDGTAYQLLQEQLEAHPQILAYGSNCVNPDLLEEYIYSTSPTASKPLVAYPNGFHAYDPVEKKFTGPMVQFDRLFKDKAQDWNQAGCKIIGGCCGSDWDDIRTLSETLKA